MTPTPSDYSLKSLETNLATLIDKLPDLEYGKWIQRALGVLIRLTGEEIERLDWKILTVALEDMEQAFQVFYPYRHVKKPLIQNESSYKYLTTLTLTCGERGK